MVIRKTYQHTLCKLSVLAVMVWPSYGCADPQSVSLAPHVTIYPADISIQQPLAIPQGVIDPFVGTSVDITKFMDEEHLAQHPDKARVIPSSEEYQFQAGVNIDLTKAVALNYDPQTQRINTELSFSSLSSKKGATKFRLRLRSKELKLVMVHKF